MTAINLQAFCATHDVREYLHQPFVIDGYTYATDRRILLRVPGGGENSDVPSRLVQSVLEMFGDEYAEFCQLPAIPKRIECKFCNGTGVDESLDDDDECFQCTGTGETPQLVTIGCSTFQAHYIRMIAALPNARMSVQSRAGAAAFIFDGGGGRVMPYLQRVKR